MSASTSEFWIPRVTKRITEEVEAENSQADGQPGEDRQPRRLLHERAASAAQHQAPRRDRRLGPEPEKAQRGLDQDRVAEPDGGDDQNWRRHVGQDVGDDDLELAAAEGLRRL